MPLEYRCELCGARPGEPCMDTTVRRGDIQQPLARGEHLARALPLGQTKEKRR
jgi:hypothetical protein